MLWSSQVARGLADNCLRMFVVLELAATGAGARDAAWHLAAAIYISPFILLSPVNGAIANGFPKRAVLVGAAGYCLAVALGFGWLGGPWTVCLALVATGAAVYSPTRFALLPAAARDTGIPLVRVNGWIELGDKMATIGGLLLGLAFHDPVAIGQGSGDPSAGFPAALGVVALCGSVSLLTALPARFRSDVRRPESPSLAIAGFFRDGKRILADAPARASLLGLAGFLGIITAGTGALVARVLSPDGGASRSDLLAVMIVISLGVGLGSCLAGIQGRLHRALGLVPWSATGLLVALGWAAWSADPRWPCFFLGIMGGMANVPLRAFYQASVPADARGNGMAIMNTLNNLGMAAASGVMIFLARFAGLGATGQLVVVAVVAAFGAAIAWRSCLRASIEIAAEVALAPFYRVRGFGPGVGKLPATGPLLVVANHACWFDPMFVGKEMPRPITPMMTSLFYDKFLLRWLMERVVKAIRVQWSQFRREAPEIGEAVAALDRGECVVIFPEGWLRRTENRPLRQFGRGVWEILRQRPTTPVVVCWIEGGWKSYTSYWKGPPTKNKRIDFWRSIRIGINEPVTLDAEVLADHRKTRAHLMHECFESRKLLGLEPLELAVGEEEMAEEEASGR